MTAAHDRTAIDAIKADRTRLTAALRNAGAQLADGASLLRCPFHEDRNASAGIHEHDGVWWYTCHSCDWNNGRSSGDIIAVVQAAHGCDFLAALEHLGVNSNGRHNANGLKPKTKPTATDVAAAEKLAADAGARLMADPEALDRLWRTRGIDTDTARKLKLGVTGEPGKRFVTMPITDARGDFVAMKSHGLDGQTGGDKGKWHPAGTDKPTQHPFPVSLTGDGPVWISAPLEAAAIISLDLPAIGYTGGESADLPDLIIRFLKSAKKPAALPADDDEIGSKWGARTLRQLTDAGIDVRIVDLGLDRAAGLKDVGDWIVRERIENARTAEAMRESLLHAYAQSDPWGKFTLPSILASPETWRPITFVKTGFSRWDDLAGGGLRTRAVHLICGKPGVGKSTLAVQVASNAALAGLPIGVFSLEMTREDMAKLIVAQNTGIPRRVLDTGQFADCYVQTFDDFKSKSAKMPLTILDDDYWQGPLDRVGLAKLVAEGTKRFGWKLVVVDYLGLLAPGENDQGNFDTDLRNSSALKRMASKFDIALLVVAALRKSANFQPKGASSKISLDDLSGAGRLAYDATSVWYVASEQQPTSPPSGTLWLHGLKARFSGAGSLGEIIDFRWRPDTGQVSDLRYHE